MAERLNREDWERAKLSAEDSLKQAEMIQAQAYLLLAKSISMIKKLPKEDKKNPVVD